MADFSQNAVDTPVSNKAPSHEDVTARALSFGSSTETPQGPPLSPYRDPTQNALSEAPTPSRTPAQPAAPVDEEAESLRLALALQADEERYLQAQEEGEARLRRLEAERRATPGGADADADEASADEDAPASDADEDDVDEDDEEEDDEEIDESLALAWRLQQEDDDRALLMAMNGGVEPPAGATARSLSPSQMTYDQLLELGDNIGKVSKGAAGSALEALPTCTFAEAKQRGEAEVIVGEQCTICRMEFEDDDVLRILPCRHADHADCIDQWLRINRSCPQCGKDAAPRADAESPAPAESATHFTAADTDDIDDLLGI